MFGLNESKTITASYEDAVKFVDGMMKEQFEELDDHAKSGSAQRLLAHLAISAKETSGAVKARRLRLRGHRGPGPLRHHEAVGGAS